MPIADILVDSATNDEFLSFMDDFSSYNQILTVVKDISKTVFRCLGSIGHLNGWSCLLVLKM